MECLSKYILDDSLRRLGKPTDSLELSSNFLLEPSWERGKSSGVRERRRELISKYNVEFLLDRFDSRFVIDGLLDVNSADIQCW